MTAFALLLATAAVAYGVGKWLRLPSIPVLIGAGMGIVISFQHRSNTLFSDLTPF